MGLFRRSGYVRPTLTPEQYADAVWQVLDQHLPRLSRGEVDREVILENITRNARAASVMELIVDGSASWRLKPHRTDPRRMRLADYTLFRSPRTTALERSINARLDEIGPIR